MSPILIIILVLLLVGAFGAYPSWNHSANWGYGPSGVIGLVLVVIVLLALFGRL